MNGVILFADNRIFSSGRENELFNLFLNDSSFSVLPIDNVECLESMISSASTFRACIIDWDFVNNETDDEEFAGVILPQRTPMSLLMENTLYTLVYIYSEKELPENERTALQNKYGNKIQFKTKCEDIASEYNIITNEIKTFESNNAHMNIPFMWSQAINQSAQTIFSELEAANSFWIKEIRDTATSDGGDATSEVIDVFNNLLNEDLIQNVKLRNILSSYNAKEIIKEENIAKLYQRIYYSKINRDAPIMTGDIFQFTDEIWGILITPECEVENRVKAYEGLEFLTFKFSDIDDFLVKSNSYNRLESDYVTLKESKKNNLRKIFNNEGLSTHILPSFPSKMGVYNQLVVVNFKNSFKIKSYSDYFEHRSIYKLNSPYIYQLRQRYISFFGKYGVPAIPESLRDYNLKG